MKKLNLLPPELQRQYEVNIKKLMIKALIISGLIFIFSLVALGKYTLLTLEKQQAELEERRQYLLPYEQDKLKLEQQISVTQTKLQEFQNIVLPNIYTADLIKQIGAVTPVDTWFTNINITKPVPETNVHDQVNDQNDSEEDNKDNYNKMNLTLDGYSVTVNSVGLLSYYLNQLPYLEQAIVEYAEEVEINGVKIVEFRIKSIINESR